MLFNWRINEMKYNNSMKHYSATKNNDLMIPISNMHTFSTPYAQRRKAEPNDCTLYDSTSRAFCKRQNYGKRKQSCGFQ